MLSQKVEMLKREEANNWIDTEGKVSELSDHCNPQKQASVTIVTGDAGNAGGSIPYIAIWDKWGHRFGQYKGDHNGHIDAEYAMTFTINPDQHGGKPAQPEYVSIVMQENDAICVSAVIAMGDAAQWTWTGDVGYTCGAQWYNSQFSIGASNSPPRCVWIDADNTNGIVAKGISMHIRDFTSDPGLLDQYKKDQRRLCQNSARMTFQPEPITPDSIIPLFNPPLDYATGGGALLKPNQGIDRHTRGYPDGTNMKIHDTGRKHARDTTPHAGIDKNNKPCHLIISNINGHSAKDLCEHPNSLGADFVSTAEHIFCDMETGKWWPLCDATHSDRCFDLEHQTMRGKKTGSKQSRGETSAHPVPKKEYKPSKVWH